MKGIDIVILGYLLTVEDRTTPQALTQQAIGYRLGVGGSLVHYALKRMASASLWQADTRSVNALGFVEFVQHGLKYVFPVELGARARGVPTAHSAPPFAEEIVSSAAYVWPFEDGKAAGPSIEPLHRCVPEVASREPRFYELMAVLDVFRVGRARERRRASDWLKELMNGS